MTKAAKGALRIAFRVMIGTALIGVQQTHAATIITNDGTGKTRFETGLYGFDFAVGPSSQVVSALGIWDDDVDDVADGTPASPATPDGLAEAHRVGLWKLDGTSLGSVLIPAGTGSTLVGEFRYVNLTSPVTLDAGATYTLAAEYVTASTDLWHDTQTFQNASSAVFGVAPEFESFRAKYGTPAEIAGFLRPSGEGYGLGTALIGPNALFAVPEPSSLAMLAMAGFALRFVRRRERR